MVSNTELNYSVESGSDDYYENYWPTGYSDYRDKLYNEFSPSSINISTERLSYRSLEDIHLPFILAQSPAPGYA